MINLLDAKWHVLIVEDEDINYVVLASIFDSETIVKRAKSGAECLQYCQQHKPDVILMDINLPGITGLETCKILRSDQETQDVVIVFVTSNNDDATQLACWDAGANDFVAKPVNVLTLKKRLEAQVRMSRQNQILSELSFMDGLTSVFNRRYLEIELPKVLSMAKRTKGPCGLLMIDIDWFKLYNDTYGHLAGDACLKSVSKELQNSFHRGSDTVCRYGGEEFICILPDTNLTGITALAQRIIDRIQTKSIEHKSSPLNMVTLSIGGSVSNECINNDASSWISLADQALYQVKDNGRNSFSIIEMEE